MQPDKNIENISDNELVKRAALSDAKAIRLITSRNNQRLYRAAWGILGNHADAEEILQEGYLKAFNSLETYSGNSSLSTWLTRIVINKAIDRQRALKSRHTDLLKKDVAMLDEYRAQYTSNQSHSPEIQFAKSEISIMLQKAVAQLPDEYRLVFIFREIEGMSTKETSDNLGIKATTVKTRLFRARRLLRENLEPELGHIFKDTIPFAGVDCEAMTDHVLASLNIKNNPSNIPPFTL